MMKRRRRQHLVQGGGEGNLGEETAPPAGNQHPLLEHSRRLYLPRHTLHLGEEEEELEEEEEMEELEEDEQGAPWY